MVLLAAVSICFSFYRQMRTELDAAQAEHSRVASQAATLQVENDRLAAEIQALRSDPEVIESAARQQLGMVRPNEVVLSPNRQIVGRQ
jgi:cell division protein FtsB